MSLPRGFGAKLRGFIREGYRPRDAMRLAWGRRPRGEPDQRRPRGEPNRRRRNQGPFALWPITNPRRKGRRQYRHERVAPKGRFDPRSFRTVPVDGHRITIGCPKGKYDARRRLCKVGTRAQRILHPKGESKRNPCDYNPFHEGVLEHVDPQGMEIRVGGRRFAFLDPRFWASGGGYRAYRALQTLRKSVGKKVQVEYEEPTSFHPTETVYGRRKVRRVNRPRINPPQGAVKIYDKLLEIHALKNRGAYAGQAFKHPFSSSAAVWGLPDGRLLIAPARSS